MLFPLAKSQWTEGLHSSRLRLLIPYAVPSLQEERLSKREPTAITPSFLDVPSRSLLTLMSWILGCRFLMRRILRLQAALMPQGPDVPLKEIPGSYHQPIQWTHVEIRFQGPTTASLSAALLQLLVVWWLLLASSNQRLSSNSDCYSWCNSEIYPLPHTTFHWPIYPPLKLGRELVTW